MAIATVMLLAIAAAATVSAAQIDEETTVGIDFGATYSCIGVYTQTAYFTGPIFALAQKVHFDGRINIIQNEHGNRITPSYVAFTDTEILVGDAAKNQATTNPKNTIFGVKNLLGRLYNDSEVQHYKQRVPYEIVEQDGRPYVQVVFKGEKKIYSPEEISSMILSKLKQSAENFLGMHITYAIMTVPINFLYNDAQRQATRDAAAMAGFKLRRLFPEHSAAATAHRLDLINDMTHILVLSLCGTDLLDVSVLMVENGIFELKAATTSRDLLQNVCRKENATYPPGGGTDNNDAGSKRMKNQEEESDNPDKRCIRHQSILHAVTKVLHDAKVERAEIGHVVLVGDFEHISEEMLKDFPGLHSNSSTLVGDSNYHVTSKEVVAYGAAMEGAIVSGLGYSGDKEGCYIDVTRLSLGIETAGGVMSKIIPRNTLIPKKTSRVFSTCRDNQTTVVFKLIEGECRRTTSTKDCHHHFGELQLNGVTPAPRGVPQIEVTFEVDLDHVLNVTAVERGKDLNNNVTMMITPHTHHNKTAIAATDRLSVEEMYRMQTAANANDGDDVRDDEDENTVTEWHEDPKVATEERLGEL